MSVKRIKKLPDEVVDRIAAGEVILRPENVLKELIENSLDASSKKISVTVSEGGLSLLQVKDDGTGIDVNDLKILCERFTTSKLSKHADLYNLQTYGFRGEALASISRVGVVTIITSTSSDNTGYTCKYVMGQPVSAASPCACSKGTTFIIEDLFYCLPVRRQSFQANDEYCRLLQVLQKYSVHYGHVSFSCKKFGSQINDLKTPGGIEPSLGLTRNTIEKVYGKTISSQLHELSVKNFGSPKFKANAFIYLSEDGMKHQTFLLFINHRLVESNPIRRCIETVASCIIQKKTNKFWCYLALEIQPESIDVNVHPTKKEVVILDIESILGLIETEFINQLKGSLKKLQRYSCGISRKSEDGFVLQEKLTQDQTVEVPKERQTKLAPQYKCRTDYRQPSLKHFVQREEFVIPEVNLFENSNETKQSFYNTQSNSTHPAHSQNDFDDFIDEKTNVGETSKEDFIKEPAIAEEIKKALQSLDFKNEADEKNDISINFQSDKEIKLFKYIIKESLDKLFIGINSGFQSIRLNVNTHPLETKALNGLSMFSEQKVVKKVYDKIVKGNNENVTKAITQSTYVGLVNEDYAVLQMSTSLVLVQLRSVFKDAVTQSIVKRLGVMNSVTLEPAFSLHELMNYSIQNSLLDSQIQDQLEKIQTTLIEHSVFLDRCFSLYFDSSALTINQIPLCCGRYFPGILNLGSLISDIALNTTWDDEEICIQQISTHIATYYTKLPFIYVNNNVSEKDLEHLFELVYYPCLALNPSFKGFSKYYSENKIQKLTSLDALYKVFERC